MSKPGKSFKNMNINKFIENKMDLVDDSFSKESKIEFILDFIKENFNEDDLKRNHVQEGPISETNIDDFYEEQENYLNESFYFFIDYLIQNIYFINCKSIKNMDKESMVDFGTSGFYLLGENYFVIFNER